MLLAASTGLLAALNAALAAAGGGAGVGGAPHRLFAGTCGHVV
jgi:hypothetical protein